MSRQHLEFGKEGEEKAKEYLTNKGFEILGQNIRLRLGELDLIAQTADELVFIEVKAGKQDLDFSPLNHFDRKKRQKIISLAHEYLGKHPSSKFIRFDLIAVVKSGQTWHIDHFEDVIQDEGL